MKTNGTENPAASMMDSVIEAQSKAVNSWVESTQKVQKAMMDGKGLDKGNDIYKEWLDSQMSIFKNISVGANEKMADANPQDMFKNMFGSQMDAVKQMTDFNQNFYNMMLNFGKSNNDIQNSFNTMNGAWTSVYNNWMNSINHAYDSMSKNMNFNTSKDAFTNMFNSSNTMFKMFELYQPIQKMMNSGNFNVANFKNMFDAAKYKEVMDEMMSSMMGKNNMNEILNKYAKNIETYFSTSSNFGKEYQANMQDMMKKMPELMSGDFAKVSEVMKNMKDVFAKTYEPMMNLVQAGKEKESLENMIATMDKAALYQVKNTQLQYLMYTAGQKSMEKTVELLSTKMKNNTEVTSFQNFFNEWVNTNEKVYLELFNSDEFSALKAEVLELSSGVKKSLENQFETNFGQYPLVFKNEMEEVYKTIYDLKKTIKNLQAKLMDGVLVEEEEETKTTKTKKATK